MAYIHEGADDRWAQPLKMPYWLLTEMQSAWQLRDRTAIIRMNRYWFTEGIQDYD
jgi:hypothetical protein